MKKILGLDLGTNSIGWSIVGYEENINEDKTYKGIIDAGVRIFPEGVEPDTIGKGDKEKSKNSVRREFRQMRRQTYRKRLRKIKLLECLIRHKMCPITTDALKQWKVWNPEKKSYGRSFPDTPEMREWLSMNPYQLRAKAVGEDITRLEFGRILYHLIQRRGFYGNLKAKDSGALYKGNDTMIGIDQTREELEGKTLGQLLNEYTIPENEPYSPVTDDKGQVVKARGRYTLRKWYVEEFNKIWERQAEHLGLDKETDVRKKVRFIKGSPNNKRNVHKINYLIEKLGKDHVEFDNKVIISYEKMPLKEYLAGEIWYDDDGDLKYKSMDSLLFWQRPIRSQKNLLQPCRFESSKKPCSISHPDFEKYRAWQFINNIKFEQNSSNFHKRSLSREEADIVFKMMSDKTSLKFDTIKKKLDKEYETSNFNKDYKVPVCNTIAQLQKLFPEDTWNMSYHDIWHAFHFFEDNVILFKHLKNRFQLIPDDPETIAKINIEKKYSSLSLKAIRNILPFLEKGYILSTAIVLGGVKNVFGNKWDLYADHHEMIEKEICRLMSKTEKNKIGELIDKIKLFLINGTGLVDFGFTSDDKRLFKLYHPTYEVKESEEIKEKLPEIENLRNPLVQQALNELRHIVNEIIDQHGKMHIIKVELSRDLRNNKKKREELQYRIRQNEKENEEARKVLTEYGLAPSRDNVRKYRLYKEIEDKAGTVRCPYTDTAISLTALLGGRNQYQIEHIFPRSISLDDSFMNITLCESNFNRMKGEKTPWQFYQENSDPALWNADSWDEIVIRAFKYLPYIKAKRFTKKGDLEQEGFVNRQLSDGRYISKKAKEILSAVCDDVQVLPGMLTSDLRRLWGLNNVLQPIESIDYGYVDFEENVLKPHWLVKDIQGKNKKVKPIYNRKPSVKPGETTIPGDVKQNWFYSPYLSEKLPAEGYSDGKYWTILKLGGPLEWVRQRNIKPDQTIENLILTGEIKNGKFSVKDRFNFTLKESLPLADGWYWAELPVRKISFKDVSKKPTTTSEQIAYYGGIQSGRFTSFVFQCKTDLPDGNAWIILDLEPEKAKLYPVYNQKPEISPDEVLITGTIDGNRIFTSDADTDHNFITDKPSGKYWVRFPVEYINPDLIAQVNRPPALQKGEKIVEGNIWVDKQGEIRFDPKKNRDDQRHHAIDALAIACTERSFLQKLSTWYSQTDEIERGRAHSPFEFPVPWDNFFQSVQEKANGILVSYKKNNPVLTKVIKKVHKNGKTYKSVGFAARGQLHKESIYGKRTTPDGFQGYHIRKSVTSLKDNKHVDKVVDKAIRNLIKDYLKSEYSININGNYNIPENAFYKDGQYRLFLPNKNGDPVPIKKVRIREKFGHVHRLKESINQYVDPQKNHHVILYRDLTGFMQENIITFWEAAERKRKGEMIYQLPEDGKEIITILEINDMFLIGLPSVLQMNEAWKTVQPQDVSPYLYRVQKLSSMDYTFRHHLASTINNSEQKLRIVSFKAWQELSPVKVKISRDNRILEYSDD